VPEVDQEIASLEAWTNYDRFKNCDSRYAKTDKKKTDDVRKQTCKATLGKFLMVEEAWVVKNYSSIL
jgi:hypothetical protein